MNSRLLSDTGLRDGSIPLHSKGREPGILQSSAEAGQLPLLFRGHHF